MTSLLKGLGGYKAPLAKICKSKTVYFDSALPTEHKPCQEQGGHILIGLSMMEPLSPTNRGDQVKERLGFDVDYLNIDNINLFS